MAQPTKLQKIIIAIIIFAVGAFLILSDMHKLKVSNIENKAKDVVGSYIATQEKLEDDGYNFTFNFSKTENKIKKSGLLNKDKDNNNFKIDGKEFTEGMGGRISKAHNLAHAIKTTIADSNVNGEYKPTKEVMYGIKQDCMKLKEIYSEDILAVDFPEESQSVKTSLQENATIFENELDLIANKSRKMNSDETLSAIRMLNNFVRTCEDCGTNK